jgi:2-keto-4-pentenoate hydratase/2-oxohepta-3-ene-1,7-dioic acid hydratase in catechol pathway
LAVGLNYADHIAETGMDTPKFPMIFNKQSTSAHPPRDPFHLPRVSDKLDYEGELGVVIGKPCRHVPKERAREVIAGYTIINDVTVRDWQFRVPTMTMGKSFDTHCPMGPWIVTQDELPDPHCLELKTWVNGELRQHSNTKHLIFDCDTLVEHLSTAFTLEPGDVIPTGTPSGVGIGFKPRKFLASGDVVRISIEGIGEIENAVIDEPAETTRIG